MTQNYTPEFKKMIVRLHLEKKLTCKSISTTYGVSKSSISKWCAEFIKEEKYHTQAITNPISPDKLEMMKENQRLRKELAEKEKEINFLKKNSRIPCKGN